MMKLPLHLGLRAWLSVILMVLLASGLSLAQRQAQSPPKAQSTAKSTTPVTSLATSGADTAKVLGLNDAYLLIQAYHPLIRQAVLMSEAAQQDLRMAKGGFDPKATVDYAQKFYNNKDYYTLLDAYVKVPTWIGLDVVGGYTKNTGLDLNSTENTADGKGLYYIGATLPIGAGLFMDQRRAVLRQAEMGITMAEAERVKAINKIVLQIAKDYWAWYEAWQTVQNNAFGYNLALERFEAVKQRVEGGDMARIDSVEARITVQDRAISLQTARLDLQQARLAFEVHLWADDNQPRELMPNVVPAMPALGQEKTMLPTEQLLDMANTRHPELIKLQTKLDQLEIDRRLSVENLKPTINLKYNYLSGKDGISNDFSSNFAQHNYQFGVQAFMPLFLRKERGKLGLTKVKLSQGQLELQQQRRTIQNEIKSAAAEMSTMSGLLVNQQTMVQNYQTLRDAEVEKFINGESSLFLVNSRESKLIEGRIKLASLQAKYQKAQAYLRWAAGMGLE